MIEFREIVKSIENLKDFCKENDYSNEGKSCEECPFMQKEGICLFLGSSIPQDWELEGDKIRHKNEVFDLFK